MHDVTRYEQRRLGYRATFDLQGDSFEYCFSHGDQMIKADIPYEVLNFPAKKDFSVRTLDQMSHQTHRIVVILIIIALSLSIVFLPHGTTLLAFEQMLLIFGAEITIIFAVCFFIKLTIVSFTEIPSAVWDDDGVRAFIYVIKDRQHDAVLHQLNERWEARLRSLYAKPDALH